jgi:NADP-dependent 3-hydroxy acid dehydrogenase YdfG
MMLQDQVTVVTGAGQGIGAAAAKALPRLEPSWSPSISTARAPSK